MQTRSLQGCTPSHPCLVRSQPCSGAHKASKHMHEARLLWVMPSRQLMCPCLLHGMERPWHFMYSQTERGQGPDGLAAPSRVGPEASQRSGKGHEGAWSVSEAAGRRRLLGGCQGNSPNTMHL